MTSQGPVSLTSPFGRKVCVCVFDCKSEKRTVLQLGRAFQNCEQRRYKMAVYGFYFCSLLHLCCEACYTTVRQAKSVDWRHLGFGNLELSLLCVQQRHDYYGMDIGGVQINGLCTPNDNMMIMSVEWMSGAVPVPHRYAFTVWKQTALPLSWLEFWHGKGFFHS